MKACNTDWQRQSALALLTFVSAGLSACGGGGSSGSVSGGGSGSGLSVSVSADRAIVQAGATAQVTAVVSNDSANRGVTWSVSCATAPCGNISPATSASGLKVTYTAPTTVPSADLAVTVTATAVSNPSQQASGTFTVPALVVTVDPQSGPSMAAGATTQFTATINYPAQANKGVTWTVQCGASGCGNVSPSNSASGTAVTYTAPASPPPADLAVTVTASSVSSPAANGSATLTVAAISIGVAPLSALVPLNATLSFTGNASYDPSAVDVDWSLTQGGTACPSACGAFAPNPTASGATTTYTAPAALPTNATATVTATAGADQSKSATATVALTSGTVELVPMDLFFASSKLRRPVSGTIALTNTGTSPLAISSMTFGGTNPALYSQTNTCGNSVAAGSSCSITVHCSRTGCGPAVLLIADSSSDSPQTIYLQGGGHYQVTAAMRAALAQQTTVASPPPSGSGQVGTRVLYLRDASRADPYVSDGTRRELPIRFWYPSSAAASCVKASYTSPQVWKYFSTLVGASLPRVSTHSCLNSPVATGPHPVVVLEHGFTGTYTDYTYLAEDLASRGYVVAAVDHTHEATAVEFPDGRLEKSVFGSHLTKYTRSDAGSLGLAVAVRLDDLRFVLNEMARLNAAPDGDLSGRLDLTRIALVGHSLGGLATIRSLESEPQFKAGVLLDGVTPPHFPKAIEQPVLSLVVGHKSWNDDDCRIWDALRGPRAAVNLPGAEHIALSDTVWILRNNVKTGTTPEAMIAATRDYVAAFLDASLRGKDLRRLLVAAASGTTGSVVADGSQPLCARP